MKWVIAGLGLVGGALLSIALAKHLGSITVAWLIGYFSAVIVVNLDRHIFSGWLK